MRLLGVDHSGFEYACVRQAGPTLSDGPEPEELARLLSDWGGVNVVRLPLNEDCWLGINGVSPTTSGEVYREAVIRYLARLHTQGLFAIVDLHWSAPGSQLAIGQQPMADRDHAPAFWRSVANVLGADAMTLFDLFNEPSLTPEMTRPVEPWACWADGCTLTVSQGGAAAHWDAAGMNELVQAVRGAGAANVVLASGLAYGNDLSGWLAHAPRDPLGQVVASFHVYDFNPCAAAPCWEAQVAPVAEAIPVVAGELGEDDCAHGFIDAFMSWADAHRLSYLGWTYNPWDCKSGPSLIRAYDGGVTEFGRGLRQHFLDLSR
jgi:hypothetical protein